MTKSIDKYERNLIEELRQAHQRLTYHVENSPIPIIEWDGQFRVKRWSKQAEKKFGWKEHEVLLRHPSEWKFVHEDYTETVAEEMQNILEKNESQLVFSSKNYTKSGDVVCSEWYTSVLMTEDGQLDSILSLHLDVTDREKAKETEKQLIQAQKLESIGQLTSGLAHDFNNLLTVIIGNLQLIERYAGDNPQILKRVRSATEATNRGSELIKRLLAFSRRQVLNPENVQINALVEQAMALLERTLGEEIELKTQLADDLWLATVDAHQLETVLFNLAINARDAMPGGGQLTFATRNHVIDEHYATRKNEVQPGEYVLLMVSDTGTGMSESVQRRVFEPFYTTKPEGKGTGLGLSMVFGFIKQSGGHIEVYSEEDVGTSFKIYLPRAGSNDGKETVSRDTDADAMPVGNETILSVDDDPDLLEVAEIFLEELGYNVICASNAQEALSILADNKNIDLLFSDIVMPGGIRGPELADCARQMNPGLKVLLTSGHPKETPETESSQRTYELLIKPYQVADLAQRVRAVLDRE